MTVQSQARGYLERQRIKRLGASANTLQRLCTQQRQQPNTAPDTARLITCATTVDALPRSRLSRPGTSAAHQNAQTTPRRMFATPTACMHIASTLTLTLLSLVHRRIGLRQLWSSNRTFEYCCTANASTHEWYHRACNWAVAPNTIAGHCHTQHMCVFTERGTQNTRHPRTSVR